MMPVGEARKILIAVGRHRDVSLAKALLRGLGAEFGAVILFFREELRESFGATTVPATCDVRACVLSAERFRALVSFAGKTTECSAEDLVLFRAFDALGLPTIEIQHDLLQAGMASSGQEAAELAPHYAARSLIAWSGPAGVGYLKSVLHDDPSPWVVRDDHVAVVSANEAPFFSERDKYCFAIAVAKLAANHPEVTFVWRPRPEEWDDPTGHRVLSMVDAYAPVLDNLVLEENESADEVVRRCSGAIAMLSTQVLDLELCDLPILLYATDHHLQAPSLRAGRTFANYAEAESLWAAFRAHPSAFRAPLGVAKLDPARVRANIEHAASLVVPAADRLAVALDQLAWLDERRAQSARLEATTAQTKLEMRVDKLEKATTKLATDLRRASATLSKVPGRLDRLLKRIGDLQRSTLAYKTKKLTGKVFGKP